VRKCAYYAIPFQIYQSSVAYSPDAIQTSGGYFHLGRVFLMEGKIDIADSLHSRVKLLAGEICILKKYSYPRVI
jgi:hypothetical protein